MATATTAAPAEKLTFRRGARALGLMSPCRAVDVASSSLASSAECLLAGAGLHTCTSFKYAAGTLLRLARLRLRGSLWSVQLSKTKLAKRLADCLSRGDARRVRVEVLAGAILASPEQNLTLGSYL